MKQETTRLGRERIKVIGEFPQTVGVQLKKFTMESLFLLLIEIQIVGGLNTQKCTIKENENIYIKTNL